MNPIYVVLLITVPLFILFLIAIIFKVRTIAGLKHREAQMRTQSTIDKKRRMALNGEINEKIMKINNLGNERQKAIMRRVIIDSDKDDPQTLVDALNSLSSKL